VILKIILLVVCSYLFGSYNISISITRQKEKDITSLGSGNPGTLNMLRNFGLGYGLISVCYDCLKGAVPSIVGYFLLKNYDLSQVGILLGGISAIIGHMYPVYYKFRGGKGIASSVGMFIVLNPIVGSITFLVMIAIIYFFQCGSLATLGYVLFMVVFETLILPTGSFVCYILLLLELALVFTAHRQNILRLIKGTEAKTDLKATILNAVNSMSSKSTKKDEQTEVNGETNTDNEDNKNGN